MFEYSNEKAIEYIFGFSHSGKPVKDLSRIKMLMSAIGDPQDRLKFVHIAGTNGKGSTARMFDGVFTRAGLKTGLFTSPFIIEYADRIQVNDRNIDSEALARLAGKVHEAVSEFPEDTGFSQFEITQAIAFLYFEEQGCDIVVLETGLGGLLDCTNIITTPLLTVITKVDLDHTAILGDTVELIAAQKAGIIKRGVPCVLSAGNVEEVRKVVAEKAKEMGSRLVIPDVDELSVQNSGLDGTNFSYKGRNFHTSMAGIHQTDNALSVIEGCELLREKLGLYDEDITKGIADAVLPGRTEILSRAPLVMLDGGHNPDGVRALAKVITGKRPCRAVIGMCRDKNLREALSVLIPHVDSFITVDGFSDRAEKAEDLADLINTLGGKATPSQNSLLNVIENMKQQNTDGLTLICGSLYLVSAVHEIYKDKIN
ncbi:MAG: bifunctional folylpolyglutamate synthase/dihydrofolate synthase [Ruminococcus sp.]|uniref:bifunctional folylpolyglutamate synthase/dihydrofolate synthase n=1 Tax=Ruminococcus sp. TaxID=41978 RepID=UPI0025EB4ABA|nr:folylpolyglutamate synthase/dihydrofolate synthase family protein [Ruminococcus sp.]MCR5541324.1 bifunctional folylpolyglutamate synthase/dihydrofolate synthase [Ruminococcus sp.]